MPRLSSICQKIINAGFGILFLLIPLAMSPYNFELFEFSKMLLTYFLTIIIVSAWVIRMIAEKKFLLRRTFWNIPLLCFLVSQFLSFLFSINRHTSFWGYYSRSNGGLASYISYVLLFLAFVNNIDAKRVRRHLNILLMSAVIVSGYGIAEHFGIDAKFWVQDVQARVFSTLGQPNWLAAWLVAIAPLTWAMALLSFPYSSCHPRKSHACRQAGGDPGQKVICMDPPVKPEDDREKSFYKPMLHILYSVFFICLLFTKSRSGISAFAVSYIIFWGLTILKEIGSALFVIPSDPAKAREVEESSLLKKDPSASPRHGGASVGMTLKSLAVFTVITTSACLVIGTPWTKSLIQRVEERESRRVEVKEENIPLSPITFPLSPAASGGGTDSGDIRKIVWKGAIEIWKHYPLFGTGPETFAYSYYWFRPREHNDTSEWDFVYNKAHNEYLNFAANTGTVGLLGYLLLIGSFIFWNAKNIKYQSRFVILAKAGIQANKKTISMDPPIKSEDDKAPSRKFKILNFALLSGFAGILTTNFFGFSVVPVNLLFFLFPAISFVLISPDFDLEKTLKSETKKLSFVREFGAFSVFVLAVTGATFLVRYWIADIKYAAADRASGEHPDLALDYCQSAVNLRPDEPLFHNEMAIAAASLAEKFNNENDATQTEKMVKIAISESEKTVTISPYNVNFWKDRSRIFYDLAKTESRYSAVAINSLMTAGKLAPTDAKTKYSLGLIYTSLGEEELGQKALEETIVLKPNYDHARYALALIYESQGQKKKAIEQLEYIIQKITPNYGPAIKELKRIKQQ